MTPDGVRKQMEELAKRFREETEENRKRRDELDRQAAEIRRQREKKALAFTGEALLLAYPCTVWA